MFIKSAINGSLRLAETRPGDILGRIGGDEFTLLLNVDDPREAAQLAEQLIDKIAVRQHLPGLDVSLGVSIGIAVCLGGDAHLETLLRSADAAMYEAKRAGRQQYRFYAAQLSADTLQNPIHWK